MCNKQFSIMPCRVAKTLENYPKPFRPRPSPNPNRLIECHDCPGNLTPAAVQIAQSPYQPSVRTFSPTRFNAATCRVTRVSIDLLDSTMANPAAQAALDYLSLDWSVLPFRARGKRPAIPWTDYQHRRPTEAEHFDLPALTIANLYRCRWHVELFFKWIKQHLRIKAFFGTSENAVKTQVWIAIAVYVLVAIVKKRIGSEALLYTILQILSLTLFEKTSLNQLVANIGTESDESQLPTQSDLFT